MKKLRVLLAQLNFLVGDLKGNKEKILKIIDLAKLNKIELVVFPEMAISGYPIQDLIFDRDFYESELQILDEIAQYSGDIHLILGGFGVETDPSHHPQYQNNAYIISQGKISKKIQKRLLPTYDVFDEKRYFWSGGDFTPVVINEIPIGVAICEDLWDAEYQVDVAEQLVQNGAKSLIIINGSPYTVGKQAIRENLVNTKVNKLGVSIAYLNLIGGQDELVFDGRSFIVDEKNVMKIRAPFCREAIIAYELSSDGGIEPISVQHLRDIPAHWQFPNVIDPLQNVNQEIIEAMAMNLRDYYAKTGAFKRIVLGLSGGIDSAFTAYIAKEAIGADKVTAILMPSKYSSKGSVEDSIQLCKNINIEYLIVPIKGAHKLFEEEFSGIFKGSISTETDDLALQNLQSRLRGVILMFYSNKYHALLVSTGNKSEIATGYCTLYGDTNGGKNVPGDLYKTQLYEVVNWINRDQEIIPKPIIQKPPSAELKENQIDQDNLPPYPVLDEILAMRIDDGLSPREIIANGKDPSLVARIERLYTNNEYKRAQLVQTIKINKKTFGCGRKIPTLKKPTY